MNAPLPAVIACESCGCMGYPAFARIRPWTQVWRHGEWNSEKRDRDECRMIDVCPNCPSVAEKFKAGCFDCDWETDERKAKAK